METVQVPDKTPCYEIKVKARNEEKQLSQDFLMYQEIMLSKNDPTLKSMVDEVVHAFGSGEVDDVVIKIKMLW